MASEEDKQFFVHVSRTLDCLGKSQDMVKFRIKMYRKIQRHLSRRTYTQIMVIVAGSKAEGLTALFESDYDRMFVLPEVVCADNTQDYLPIRHTTLFQTERHDTPAGYTKLKLVKCEGKYFRSMIHDSLFLSDRGDRYLSSDFCTMNIAKHFVQYNKMNHHERSGPFLPSSNKTSTIHYDTVAAFCCVCPDLLHAFINRPRLYNIPARSILNEISKLEGHVVPVGYKGSVTSYQEWRICFTKAEIHLVQSFNDTENKLYILLKMISKILKKISKDITSYVMKNIVLWLVELYPVGMFTEELLTTRLIGSLVFLKKCAEINYIPSYMIPERNLLTGQLNQTQRHKLTTALSTLIHDGGTLLTKCEKLQVAMSILYREPAMTEEFRRRREIYERLKFLMEICRLEKLNTTDCSEEQVTQLLVTDKTCEKNSLVSLIIILPELADIMRLGYRPEVIAGLWYDREIQLLS